MAQIPDYTALGERPTPTPSYRRPLHDESGQILASGIESLGQGLGKATDDQYEQNQKLLYAKGENSVLDHQLALEQASQTMRQQIASGDVPYDQARAKFDAQVSSLPQPDFTGLNPVVAQSLQRSMQRNVAKSQFDIDNSVSLARKDDFKGQFGDGLDKFAKLAGMPGADIDQINQQAEVLRPLARSAGLPEAFVDKTMQDFKDKNWLNQATQRSMEAKDNMGALKGLEHDLTASDGFYSGKLDTDKRNIVLRSVINDRLVLENRMEHEQDKREAKAQGALMRIDEQIASGVPATPDMWSNWESTIKGTSFEGEFKQRLDDESKVQGVLRQPIDQQIKYVQQRQQDLLSHGGTLRDQANLQRLTTAVNQNVNLMQKAPLLFSANRNGTEVQPLDFSSLSTPEGKQAFTQNVSDRMATLSALRKQYGPQIAVQPLLPEEAAQLGSQLQNATPAARVQMLMGLRSGMNNDAAYEATMRQIAPRSPVTAIAGQIIGGSAPASTPVWFDQKFAANPQDVERVLRGEALLNPRMGGKEAAQQEEAGKGALKSGMPLPPDAGASGLRTSFAQASKDIFRDRPQLADAYYSVFKSAYASLAAEKGDMKGQLDSTLEKRALQIALGNRVNFNGNTLSVPSGMDPSRFEGLVHNAVAGSMKAWKAPTDWQDRLSGYQLREVGGLGSGRYVLTDGNGPIVRPDHKGPLTIDLRQQFYPGPGVHGSPEDQQRMATQ